MLNNFLQGLTVLERSSGAFSKTTGFHVQVVISMLIKALTSFSISFSSLAGETQFVVVQYFSINLVFRSFTLEPEPAAIAAVCVVPIVIVPLELEVLGVCGLAEARDERTESSHLTAFSARTRSRPFPFASSISPFPFSSIIMTFAERNQVKPSL